MALLAISSVVFPANSSLNCKPTRDPSSAAALITAAKSSRFFHSNHSLALPSGSSIGMPIFLKAGSKRSVKAASQPPKYVYPDPNPEFAREEAKKFQAEIMRRLLKNRETFGEDIDEVVSVCSEIFSKFLHNDYGGPGTFLVEPFTDMLLALKARQLPGAAAAARTALLWAQSHVDTDWEIWASQAPK